MPSLGDIEQKVKTYGEARRQLTEKVTKLEDELAAVKRRHIAAIRRLVDGVTCLHNELKAALEGAPELFVKPRTLTLHGVKVGFAKGKGKLVYDKDQTVKLIEKKFPGAADDLIKITKSPIAAALNRLTVADLKRIGVDVVDADDEVVIKTTDSEIDKLVEALLKDGEDQ